MLIEDYYEEFERNAPFAVCASMAYFSAGSLYCEPWYPQPTKKKREAGPMETLYDVIVVSRDREILLDKKVIASDEDEATLKAEIGGVLTAKGISPKHVTILHKRIGEVKVRKPVQRVMIVDNDDD